MGGGRSLSERVGDTGEPNLSVSRDDEPRNDKRGEDGSEPWHLGLLAAADEPMSNFMVNWRGSVVKGASGDGG